MPPRPRPASAPTHDSKQPSSSLFGALRKLLLPLALIVMFIASIGSSIYWYREAHRLQSAATEVAAKAVDMKATIEAVGKLIELPGDEQPTFATVTDPEKLKTQAFFANARIGDVVLMYTNAKKAILYRPSEGKIIDVAPINLAK